MKKINRKLARYRASLINSIINTSTEKYGSGSTTLLSSNSISSIVKKTISTNCVELDRILAIDKEGNYGMPVGRIVGVSGEEACGKTTLIIMLMISVQKMGGLAILVETEHAFDPNYAKQLGLNTDELLFSQPEYLEQGLDMIQDYVKQFKQAKQEYLIETGKELDVPMVIAFDSIAGAPPRAEIEAETFEDEQARALHARKLSKFFRVINGQISKEQICLVCTNQTKVDTEVRYGSKAAEIGGKALKFHASIRLDLKRKAFIKETKEGDPVGIETKAKTVKNKVMPPYKEAIIPIIFGEGVSYGLSLFNLLKKKKVIKRSGSLFYIKDPPFAKRSIKGRGKTAFLKELSKYYENESFKNFLSEIK